MNLLIFTPTWLDEDGHSALHPECAAAIEGQAWAESDQVTWQIGLENPCPIGDYRNVLHQYQEARAQCLAGTFEALLTIEHDNVLPDRGAVQRMFGTAADVVYAPYTLRHGLHILNVFRYPGSRPANTQDSLSYHHDELQRARQAVIWRVSGAGFGCTLIRRHVLERIEFTGATAHDGNWCPDLRFADDCARAGLVSVARFDVPVTHIDPESGARLLPYTRRELRALQRETEALAGVPESRRNRARSLQ